MMIRVRPIHLFYFLPLWQLLAASAQSGAPSAASPDNGIIVGEPKVYDNAALQQMLDSARARLAGMQFLDSSQVAAHVGTLQGASMQQSGVSFSVNGPPIAGVQTTANTGNTVTTTNQGTSNQLNSGSTQTTTGVTTATGTSPGTTNSEQLQVTGPSATSTSTGNTQAQATGPSTQTVSTLAQQNPAAASAPAMSTFTLPSSFAPGASDVLNQQMQLNAEVESLALLLEGALSDQYYRQGSVSFPKRRVTVGIPVSIVPTNKYKDAVAEIDLTVTSTVKSAPPAITAILPQDKTYNVATIASKSASIGGGVVTGVLTAGVNFAWQKQTYYIVQDQDTVALQYPSDPTSNSIAFGWQLRPVLGRQTVTSGMRTLFVQLALPPDFTGNQNTLASVSVSTRWKRINRKLNTVDKKEIDARPSAGYEVPNIDPAPQIGIVGDPVDNGDGTITVHLSSTSYLQGTYIKIGTAVIAQGSALALFDSSHIDFTVPSAVLATQRAFLSDRSGAYTEIVDPRIGRDPDAHCFSLDKPSMVPVTSSLGRLTVAVTLNPSKEPCKTVLNGLPLHDLHLVASIGNKVFGYREAPMTVDDAQGTLTFFAPIDLLRTSPAVTIVRPLWGLPFRATATFNAPLVPTIDKAPVIAKSGDNLQIALFGSNLQQLTPPSGMKFNATGKACDQAGALPSDVSNTARILCVPQSLTSTMDQIPLRASSGDLLLIAMPTNPVKATPSLDPHGPIQARKAIILTLTGSHLDGFSGVTVGTTRISGAKLAQDKNSIHVPLPASVVTTPSISLDVSFKDSHPVTLTLPVIDQSIQVTQSPTRQ